MPNKIVLKDKVPGYSYSGSGMGFISKQMMVEIIKNQNVIIVDPEFERKCDNES